MSLFDDHLAAGLSRAREMAGGPVSYSTGTGSPVEVDYAAAGLTKYEGADTEGVIVTLRSVDFLIAVADLPDITPAPGHRITQGAATFEVLPLGDSPCFRYSDESRSEYRIHTKEVV